MKSYPSYPTYMQLSRQHYLLNPLQTQKYHITFMPGSGTKLFGRIRLFPSVQYCILPGAVWYGAAHTFSHTRFYFTYFTTKYRLLPNPEKACIFPIFDIFFSNLILWLCPNSSCVLQNMPSAVRHLNTG